MSTLSDGLRRHATAATAAVFVVVGLSGVLMFFHLGEAQVKELHEWLGLGFVAFAALHVWRNGAAFARLVTRPATHVALGVASLAAAGFMLAADGDGGGNPMGRFVRLAEQAPLSALAPVLGVSEEMRQVARDSGQPMPKLFAALTSPAVVPSPSP